MIRWNNYILFFIIVKNIERSGRYIGRIRRAVPISIMRMAHRENVSMREPSVYNTIYNIVCRTQLPKGVSPQRGSFERRVGEKQKIPRFCSTKTSPACVLNDAYVAVRAIRSRDGILLQFFLYRSRQFFSRTLRARKQFPRPKQRFWRRNNTAVPKRNTYMA